MAKLRTDPSTLAEFYRGQRNPYDGLPYYCSVCGVGFYEYMSCEDECLLESTQEAEARAAYQRQLELPLPAKGSQDADS